MSPARARSDAELTETITAVHATSYGTYGAGRVHAELQLGQGEPVRRKRVERMMRCHRLSRYGRLADGAQRCSGIRGRGRPTPGNQE